MNGYEIRNLARFLSSKYNGEVTYDAINRYGQSYNKGKGPSVGEAMEIGDFVSEYRSKK